jgi:hypothetical protein
MKTALSLLIPVLSLLALLPVLIVLGYMIFYVAALFFPILGIAGCLLLFITLERKSGRIMKL